MYQQHDGNNDTYPSQWNIDVTIHYKENCTNDCSSPQARTEYLRGKARAALQSEGGTRDDDVERRGGGGALEHLNLFPLEESSEKKGNEEYLKEKNDEKVLVLHLL